jgi:hypothetical protein
MANLPPYPDSNSDTSVRPDRRSPPGIPRWVKVFGIIFIALVLAFVILHLTGNSLGGPMGHAPSIEYWLQQP